jgi:hypothetical protein
MAPRIPTQGGIRGLRPSLRRGAESPPVVNVLMIDVALERLDPVIVRSRGRPDPHRVRRRGRIKEIGRLPMSGRASRSCERCSIEPQGMASASRTRASASPLTPTPTCCLRCRPRRSGPSTNCSRGRPCRQSAPNSYEQLSTRVRLAASPTRCGSVASRRPWRKAWLDAAKCPSFGYCESPRRCSASDLESWAYHPGT